MLLRRIMFLPNLQIVTVHTPEGKVRLKVTTSVMSSRNFQDYLTGAKPLPKALTKKSRQHVKKKPDVKKIPAR